MLLATVYDLMYSIQYELRFQNFKAFETPEIGSEITGDFSSSLLNVIQISQTFSWLIYPCKELWGNQCEPQTRFKAFVVASYRRGLCYGFYKSFHYLEKVHADCVALDKEQIIHELVGFKEFLEKT